MKRRTTAPGAASAGSSVIVMCGVVVVVSVMVLGPQRSEMPSLTRPRDVRERKMKNLVVTEEFGRFAKVLCFERLVCYYISSDTKVGWLHQGSEGQRQTEAWVSGCSHILAHCILPYMGRYTPPSCLA